MNNQNKSPKIFQLSRIYHQGMIILKNLTFLLPFQFGYYRELNKLADKNYIYERDKDPVREKHHSQGGWAADHIGAFHYRDYDSYNEYQIHQKQKFDEMLKIKGGFSNKEILRYRIRFFRRFYHLYKFIPLSSKIICAGARQGTEVEVLRDLGFHQAIGIDLNPGPDNKYVRSGDFMAMDFPDASIDLVYSNCLDHAYNLEQFICEHIRVLKPGGFALYDIAIQGEAGGGAFEAVEWDSEETLFLLMLRYFGKVLKVETEKSWKWVLLQK